jgi:hypothetical protein
MGTLTDTLEGITDLHEMLAKSIRSALVDEATQAGLRSRLEDMKTRLARASSILSCCAPTSLANCSRKPRRAGVSSAKCHAGSEDHGSWSASVTVGQATQLRVKTLRDGLF